MGKNRKAEDTDILFNDKQHDLTIKNNFKRYVHSPLEKIPNMKKGALMILEESMNPDNPKRNSIEYQARELLDEIDELEKLELEVKAGELEKLSITIFSAMRVQMLFCRIEYRFKWGEGALRLKNTLKGTKISKGYKAEDFEERNEIIKREADKIKSQSPETVGNKSAIARKLLDSDFWEVEDIKKLSHDRVKKII